MGSKPPTPSHNNSFYQSQFSQYSWKTEDSNHCCSCIMFQRMGMPEWQHILLLNCQDLGKQNEWARKIRDFIYNKKFQRNSFLMEINQVITYQQKLQFSERQSLINQQDIKKFKENLKSSFLLQNSRSKTQKRLTKISQQINESVKRDKTQSYLSEFGKPVFSQQMRQSKLSFQYSRKSFIQDTITIFFSNPVPKISKEDAHSLDVFLNFTKILERHLADPNHIFKQIIGIFHQYIYQAFPANRSFDQYQVEILVKHVKLFLVVMRNTLEDFYEIIRFADNCVPPNHLIANPDNLLILVTTIVFKDISFYNHIFKVMKSLHKNDEKQLMDILQKMQVKTPSAFHVHDSYCLSETSLSQTGKSSFSEGILQPYKASILKIQKLKTSRTPIGKIKLIIECAEKITESISEFYEEKSKQDMENFLDADQILSIFSYIIVKSKVEDIHTHLCFLQNFATENQLISSAGYYCSVINAALQQLQIENSHSNIDTIQ